MKKYDSSPNQMSGLWLFIFILFSCTKDSGVLADAQLVEVKEFSRLNTISVKPVTNNDYLLNPGKGWIIYSDFDYVSNSAWEKASIGYSRYFLNDIFTADNTFDWSSIDADIATCIDKGKKFAFGVMPVMVNDSTSFRGMPEWMVDAGCSFYYASGVLPLGCKVPVWDDPVYLAKMQQFTTALANRYNGNPNIAFIDNRHYGNWGEWNQYNLGEDHPSDSILNGFVDMWSGFDSTFIVHPNSGSYFDYSGGNARYARDTYNHGWREDSANISSRFYSCAEGSKSAPIVAEYDNGTYENLKQKGLWNDAIVGSSIAGSKYSYSPLGGWNGYNQRDADLFLSEKEDLIDEWQNKMGYWFKMTAATFPRDLANGTNGVITFSMRNEGVARQCIVNFTGCVKLALMDNNYNILQTVELSDINPYNWIPTQTKDERANFSFPLTPGAEKLALGVFTNSELTDPDTKLGINNGTSENWYVLSDMVSEY